MINIEANDNKAVLQFPKHKSKPNAIQNGCKFNEYTFEEKKVQLLTRLIFFFQVSNFI